MWLFDVFTICSGWLLWCVACAFVYVCMIVCVVVVVCEDDFPLFPVGGNCLLFFHDLCKKHMSVQNNLSQTLILIKQHFLIYDVWC